MSHFTLTGETFKMLHAKCFLSSSQVIMFIFCPRCDIILSSSPSSKEARVGPWRWLKVRGPYLDVMVGVGMSLVKVSDMDVGMAWGDLEVSAESVSVLDVEEFHGAWWSDEKEADLSATPETAPAYPIHENHSIFSDHFNSMIKYINEWICIKTRREFFVLKKKR